MYSTSERYLFSIKAQKYINKLPIKKEESFKSYAWRFIYNKSELTLYKFCIITEKYFKLSSPTWYEKIMMKMLLKNIKNNPILVKLLQNETQLDLDLLSIANIIKKHEEY